MEDRVEGNSHHDRVATVTGGSGLIADATFADMQTVTVR